MKKFLIAAVVLLFLCIGAWYGIYYKGIYLQLGFGQNVAVRYSAQEKALYKMEADGRMIPLQIKGVDVLESLPGQDPFAALSKDVYIDWLERIGAMGANVVRVNTIMSPDFYEALYQYNEEKDAPLYLLQGINVRDDVNDGAEDAFRQSFRGTLLEDSRMAVDVIHGRRWIGTERHHGGWYRFDVSRWVIGYLVGASWSADTIAYTDHMSGNTGVFDGDYFHTTTDAAPFEAVLAEVMDAIVGYESNKYKEQRLIGFINSQDIDFLQPDMLYGNDPKKFCFLDGERVVPKKTLKSGYYAAYRLESGVTGRAYLEAVASHHTVPVIAAGFGISTARGAALENEPPVTEHEQGEQLMAVWDEAVDAGWSGGFISTWQDAWMRKSWNTAFSIRLSSLGKWHDLQTEGQNYGLMAFSPGVEAACVIDGKRGEWKQEEPVFSEDGTDVYLRYDEECMYLMIDGVDTAKPLYVPMDTAAETGSRECAAPVLHFSGNADFILCIDGKVNTRLLVQERYDAMRENFLHETTGKDPFVRIPDQETDVFSIVQMAVRPAKTAEDYRPADDIPLAEQARYEPVRLKTYETGRLRYGVGNPKSPAYDSLADFCFGEGCVELRLPWSLINVGEPQGMAVHQDYYQNYGVKTKPIRTFKMGIGHGSGQIELHEISVKDWKWDKKLKWRQRLKASYDVIQKHWRGEGIEENLE